jgi:aminoglycoside 6-adenylyltransferase
MLVWRIEIDHQGSVAYGRRLKKWLPQDLWADLESTYVSAGLEENWEALFRTINLLRKVALEVGDRLGFGYPQELERQVVAYIQKARL